MKTKLLIGAIALSILMFTGCGGGSSSSGSSTPPPVQPIDPNNPPLSNGYHEILLPGYTYIFTTITTYEMYVEKKGEIYFDLVGAAYVLKDSNYNDYYWGTSENSYTQTISSGSIILPAGQYYLVPAYSILNEKITFSVQSNVLYNPLAQ